MMKDPGTPRICQSLWPDNITRGLPTSGTIVRYFQEFSVTELTSNPTIFDHAIQNSDDYIRLKLNEGKPGEELFFEMALEHLMQAADQFRPIHELTNGLDCWVSLEVSPLLAHDTAGTLAAAKALHVVRNGRTSSSRFQVRNRSLLENSQIPLASRGLGFL
jgi:transaldolase